MSIDLESFYKDLHRHPELGFSEHRTSALAAGQMRALGLEVTEGVGGTGVIAVLQNGDGPVVHLRADMDALPVREQTGLDYASTGTAIDARGVEVPVMHACGHDMHVTCLIGAVSRLVERRTEWSGTLVAVFQPAEEGIAGAAALVADGYLDRFPRASVVLGQHVAPLPAGVIALHSGVALASTDSIDVVFTGRGGHGSRPHTTIDPLVTAAATVQRFQGIVSREVEPGQLAVVTVGSFHAGSKSSIIPATATLGLNVRAVDPNVRTRVLTAIERIARAEAAASGMTVEPVFTVVEQGDATINDPSATERVRRRFAAEFGEASVQDLGVASGSEDVGVLALAANSPLVFWFLGGIDPATFAAAIAGDSVEQDIPSNHSPFFAPVVQPTISHGVAALTGAAFEWLGG
ncbi:amidohydrolase [Cryobacterium sp. SO2]|uniref:amidohydrolase n=1 Tax=Cryobacterium sp. SO2 TaxID=1897060 RepID=UPI00223CB7F3|nr:amidohydrolase [Cryobacterium sp. SO2]WEO78928.1 amidohydrolase [Cryobacterium sp. SO2]